MLGERIETAQAAKQGAGQIRGGPRELSLWAGSKSGRMEALCTEKCSLEGSPLLD